MVSSVSRTAVVAIVIATSKTLSEIVLVFAAANIEAVVAVVAVLIGEGITIVVTPAVVSVSPTGTVSLPVTLVQCPDQQITAVPACVVIAAVSRIAIVIAVTIVVTRVEKSPPVTSQAIVVGLLEPQIPDPTLLPELATA